MDGRELVQELRSRHISSTSPTSRALVATIDALIERLEATHNAQDLMTYLGACVSSLESISNVDDAPVLGAVCTLLATILPHVSQQQTRTIYRKTEPVVTKVVELLHASGDAAGLKWAAQVLALLLRYPDPEVTWPTVKKPLLVLVNVCKHSNAKVRKMSQEGLTNVLIAYQQQGGSCHVQASKAIQEDANMVLAAPEWTSQQAAKAKKDQRAEAEENIMKSVSECLYLMGVLKLLIPYLTKEASKTICGYVVNTFKLAQPMLTMNGVEILIQALPGLDSPKIQALLQDVLPQIDTLKPASVLLSLIRFVEDALRELHEQNPTACEKSFSSAVLKLVEMLGAETEDVRFAAGSAVTSVFQCCVSEGLVQRCAAPSAPQGSENVLQRCMVALGGLLGVGYRDSWTHVLRCLAAIFTVLGPAGAPLAVPLMEVICNMAREGQDQGEHVATAKAAVGACISSIGPQVLLQVAPIDLHDLANCNTWILPLLRKHTRCTQMALWGEYFLPRARAVGTVAGQAREAGKSNDHLKLSALELQMWNVLESFTRWAHDVPEALKAFGETLGAAFHSRMDLQVPICGAIRQLCAQTSAALQHAGIEEGAGYGMGLDADTNGDLETATTVAMPMFEDSVPSHFDAETAKSHRDALQGIAHKWLTELFNRFGQLKPDKRAPVAAAISAMAMVAREDTTAEFYKEALQRVLSSLKTIKEGGNIVGDPEALVCTFLEVALLLAGGIKDEGIVPLFTAARLTLAVKKPAPQKKAYKVLSYVFTRRPAVLQRCKEQAVTVLLESASTDIAAKRFRLQCMQPVIVLLSRDGESAWCSPTDQPAQAAQLIAEVVLGIKEVNAKARTEAYRILAATAHALHEADPPVRAHHSGEAMKLDDGGLQRMFACTLAGVASQTPRMISASVMALARLLFEFPGELQLPSALLLPSLCALLRSKAREVIKSVLGFLKVAAVRLPPEVLQQHLKTVIEGLLIWGQDSKNRFKMKVRRLLERLCKKCGYEAVAAAWPDADPKLLSSIRKGLARAAREKTARKGISDDGDMDEDMSQGSGPGYTVSGSQWRHTQVFSDEEGEGVGEDGNARSRAGQSVAASSGRRSKGASAARDRKAKSRGQLVNEGASPMNLLDSSAASQLMRTQAGKGHGSVDPQEGAETFERNAEGKFVFKEQKQEAEEYDPFSTKGRKRRRADPSGIESDDSDFADMRDVGGLKAAYKGTQGAQSLKGASKYAHSHASGASMKSKASRATDPGQHSADKFKAKKASGDKQGASKVEPYAYWRFDKNMLNTRAGKHQRAKSQLGNMVKGGAVRGQKAKKARRTA